jgi:hypothetical protein
VAWSPQPAAGTATPAAQPITVLAPGVPIGQVITQLTTIQEDHSGALILGTVSIS